MKVASRDLLVLILTDLSIVLYLYFQSISGYLITEPQALPTLYALLAILFILSVLASVASRRLHTYARYLHASFVFSLIVLLLLNERLIATPFIIMPLLVSLITYADRYPGRRNFIVLALFVGIEFLFVFISGIIRYEPVSVNNIILGSIYDDENPAGVPALFAYSDYVSSGHLVMTLSPVYLLLTGFLASVITQNFSMIYNLVSGTGRYLRPDLVGSGLVLFSCQCEGILAALPSLASLVVNLIFIPLIAESAILVVMTNLLLQTYFLRNRGFPPFERHREQTSMKAPIYAILLLAPIILLIYGSLLGWQYTIYFFFGMNIVMYLDGMLFFIILAKVANLNLKPGTLMASGIFTLCSTAMFVWFIPPLVASVLQNFVLYGVMILVTFAAGLGTGFVYSTISTKSRGIYWETIAMMISLLALVMLYYTAEFGYSPWASFGASEVFFFSIVLVALSYPLLWITTNAALSRVAAARAA